MDPTTQRRLADGAACLSAALDYLRRGWSVLPLCPPDHVGVGRAHGKRCTNPGKTPFVLWKEYQERLPTEAEVRGWWQSMANANVGLALGPVSGLIRVDVEGTAGGEALLLASKGDLPETLRFKSGRSDGTGFGLLYRIPPGVTLRTTAERHGAKQELRFQAKGAQTVLPPSRHKDGGLYAWDEGLGPADMAAAFAPEWLLSELAAKSGGVTTGGEGRSAEEWDSLFAGVDEGGRNDSAASFTGGLLSDLRDLSGNGLKRAWASVSLWNERNDPPLPEDELRKVFTSILKKERVRREEEEQGSLDKMVERQVIASTETPPPCPAPCLNGHAEPCQLPDWHLVIIEGDPPDYLLRAPFWSGKPKVAHNGGYIKLTVKQLSVWNGLRDMAVAQADTRPPDKIKGWGSLLQRLLDAAEHRNAPQEAVRPRTVDYFVWDQLRRAKDVKEEDDGSLRLGSGMPKKLPDGKTIVKLDWLAQYGATRATPVSQKEILDAMQRAGMVNEILGNEKKRSRWWTVTDQKLDELALLVLGEPNGQKVP